MYLQAFKGNTAGLTEHLLYAFMLIKYTIPKENCNLHYHILPSAGQQVQCQKT